MEYFILGLIFGILLLIAFRAITNNNQTFTRKIVHDSYKNHKQEFPMWDYRVEYAPSSEPEKSEKRNVKIDSLREIFMKDRENAANTIAELFQKGFITREEALELIESMDTRMGKTLTADDDGASFNPFLDDEDIGVEDRE